MGEEVREDESALTSRKALLMENGSPPVSIRTWSVSETLTANSPLLAGLLPPACRPLARRVEYPPRHAR